MFDTVPRGQAAVNDVNSMVFKDRRKTLLERLEILENRKHRSVGFTRVSVPPVIKWSLDTATAAERDVDAIAKCMAVCPLWHCW